MEKTHDIAGKVVGSRAREPTAHFSLNSPLDIA